MYCKNADMEFVAEHILGFERGRCHGAYGFGGSNVDVDAGIYCDQCGERRLYGDIPPCPKYKFPRFSFIDVMRALGENRMPVMVRYDILREARRFTITGPEGRICDTDTPLEDLCAWLAREYRIDQGEEQDE